MTIENFALIDFIKECGFTCIQKIPDNLVNPLLFNAVFEYWPLKVFFTSDHGLPIMEIYFFDNKETSCLLGSIEKNECYPINWRSWNIIKTKVVKELYRAIPEDVAVNVWYRDKGKCVYCGSDKNIEYDHIFPFVKGGTHHEHNVQLLCQKMQQDEIK